ncbi:MAG: tRNA (cytidine(56)-2'-O)-methyltransferase, partial [Nanoarchaeota archaeon]|nr:tRNA (cytidine(56)-2'-O)-methyltransferase [Nanoarchaeota archaeon]
HKNMRKIPKNKNLLILVGGEKVPGEVYQMADLNIAVTNQPHSEIAALALFLDMYFSGKELDKKFTKAKLRIIPQEKGKKILSK